MPTLTKAWRRLAPDAELPGACTVLVSVRPKQFHEAIRTLTANRRKGLAVYRRMEGLVSVERSTF